MKNTMNITRRISLIIDSKDKVFVKDTYQNLYRWREICFRSANHLMTHQFIQDQIKNMVYLTEETRARLADVKKDPDGMLVTSPRNSTYQLLGHYFKGTIPMAIISCLNRALVNTYFKNASQYRSGQRSLPNQKPTLPIPFNSENLRRLTSVRDGKEFSFTLFSIPFRTYLGRDTGDTRKLLNDMIDGKVKFCGSSILLNKAKITLLATFEVEKEKHTLNSDVIAEASLSLDVPVIVKIGKATYTIGNKEEFLHRRIAIQSARDRIRNAVKYCRRDKGRKRREKALENYRHAEKRYVENKLNMYSRELINICLKNHAATLILVEQQEKEAEAIEDSFVLRHWTGSGLRNKIQYKAERVGITLIVE